jgi:purine-cytosine permease-like protein
MSVTEDEPIRIGSGSVARDDYALTKVPPTWRYRTSEIVLSLMGGATAAIFLSLPAGLAESFGIGNVLIAILYAVVVQTLLNLLYVKAASRTGLGSSLMSRGLGLGFDGAAWTTLLYWVSWLTYFATEGQILSSALTAQTGLPLKVSYLLVGLVFLPLVLYGLQFVAKFQKWTLYLYIVGMGAVLAVVLSTADMSATSDFLGAHFGAIGGVGLLGAIASYNGLVGNVAFGHADMGRLLASGQSLAPAGRRGPLWVALLPYAFGAYVIAGGVGLFLWAASDGDSNPGNYMVTIMGVAGFLLIVLTQLRINLINAYSGSLALANFFSRLHFTPGRSFWAIAMVALGTLAMYLDVLGNLDTVLTLEGVLLAAWVGVTFADLFLVRGRGKHGPDDGRFIEYRRPMLPRWNRSGVIPLFVATAVGSVLALGGLFGHLGGEATLYLSNWVSFLIASGLTWFLGVRARGGSYAIRPLIAWPREDLVVACPLDGEVVSTDDLFPCPHHKKWICSQDCMQTKGCGDACRSMSEPVLLEIAALPPRTPHLEPVNERLRAEQASPTTDTTRS